MMMMTQLPKPTNDVVVQCQWVMVAREKIVRSNRKDVSKYKFSKVVRRFRVIMLRCPQASHLPTLRPYTDRNNVCLMFVYGIVRDEENEELKSMPQSHASAEPPVP